MNANTPAQQAIFDYLAQHGKVDTMASKLRWTQHINADPRSGLGKEREEFLDERSILYGLLMAAIQLNPSLEEALKKKYEETVVLNLATF